MGFGSFLHKISSGSKNFFHKIDHGANNFFHKTIPHIAKKVGGGLEQAGGVINTGLRKVGNTLEKNSAILGDVGAGLAMALGQPELAAISLTAGNAGQQLGSNIKSVRGRVNNAVSTAQSQINRGVNKSQSMVGDVRGAVRNYNTGQTQSIQPN